MTRKVSKCPICNHTKVKAVGKPGASVVTCEKCGVAYDQKTRRLDRANLRVSPSDCNHESRVLLRSGRSIDSRGASEHYRVYLCHDCGQFSVSGDRNGQFYNVHFTLCRDDDVHAAGQWARMLTEESEQENAE